MDLPRCVDALERPSNFAYQWNFVRNLKARMRRKVAAFPDRFSAEPLDRIRTVRDFDEAYTAPHFGFRDATDYYYRAASLRVVDRIQLPALIVTAADDPFVPPEPFSDPAVTGNPHITTMVSPHGGHCAFVSAANGVHDGYWAEWKARRNIADCRLQIAGLRNVGRWAPQPALEFGPSVPYSAIGNLHSAICSQRGARIRRFANSGPFPSSSCLKYTNVSFH